MVARHVLVRAGPLPRARGDPALRRRRGGRPDRRLRHFTTSGAEGDDGAAPAADVQTIAVSRDHWGTGLGSRLLTELLRAATAFECAEVMLECRVDNVRAQKLYERFGFEVIGVRRGYYQPGNVDALVMRLTGPSSSVTPGHPVNGVQGTEIHG